MNSLQANAAFNALFNQMNGIYHEYVKQYNLTECQFWILYALNAEDRPLTQSELQNYIITPKQTIHSAILKMIENKLITLKEKTGNRKFFILTEKGKLLSQRTVKKVIQKEISVFDAFTTEERKMLIHLFSKYIQLLEGETNEDTII